MLEWKVRPDLANTFLFLIIRKLEEFSLDENSKSVNPTIAKVRHEFYHEKRLQKLYQIGEVIELKKAQ